MPNRANPLATSPNQTQRSRVFFQSSGLVPTLITAELMTPWFSPQAITRGKKVDLPENFPDGEFQSNRLEQTKFQLTSSVRGVP
jgi:hypothetical protein